MPLINDLLQIPYKALLYCSLGMASRLWVMEMTERAWMISSFITPSGLYEWLRMPFGLRNAPQIYQHMVDNAWYGYLTIGDRQKSSDHGVSQHVDVFTDGKSNPHRRPSVLGRRSYIDDILILASSWTSLYQKVNRLLEVCDQCNLSICLPKSVWGWRKVEYLGH